MDASSVLIVVAVALLVSPAISLACISQTFSQQNIKFENCMDLQTLKASLHWNYDPTAKPDPTLAIAFIAPPAKPDGWVAWALNPTGTGMIGAQALIAFKDTNGSVVVKTYNISSYGPVSESKISYDVLNKSAESSGGLIKVFATLVLPAGDMNLNQVWQVGSAVNKGVPAKHEFSPGNLNAKNTLQLVRTSKEGSDAPAPAPERAAARGGRRSGDDSGGSSRVWGSGFVLYGMSVLLAVSIFGFQF